MKNAFLAAFGGAAVAVMAAMTLVLAGPQAEADEPPGSACERMFAWIIVDRIRFRQSSAHLLGSSLPVLERLAEFAHDCPATRIRITGHTDSIGSPEYNRYLSEQRAAAVAGYLAERGVDRDRLVVRGEGANQPVADNSTAFGRERNRRIELELIAPD